MHRAKQEIFSVDVIDVYRIAVTPARGPWLRDYKPISAILKARCSLNDYRLTNSECVLSSKVGTETVVGNAATLPALNGPVTAIILPGLLVATPVVSISVLFGLTISVLVLPLVLLSILLCAFVVLSIWTCIIPLGL
jgi:hypothetical protein